MPKKYWYFSILSGVLLSMPWYDVFPGVILFVAFIPLLVAEHFIFEQKKYFSSQVVFLMALVTFFTWNLLSLWWVIKISVTAAMLIILVNTVLYALIFWLFHVVKRLQGMQTGRIAFVAFWIAFEYYSLHAEFSLPWLILGNGLSNPLSIIQWYEYTGVLGGSFWILFVNILLFDAYRLYHLRQLVSVKYLLILVFVVVAIPVCCSLLLFRNIKDTGEDCKVALIQPNVNPFIEKFSGLSQDEQLNRMLRLADSLKISDADYYLAPETAIDNDIWEDALTNNYSLFEILNFIEQHPYSTFFFGAITYKDYAGSKEKTPTMRYDSVDRIYYDVFNSAIQIDTSKEFQIYHKSKLALGAEKIPFPSVFRFFDRYLINLGGITGSLGEQKERDVFKHARKDFIIAPVICYESVFGEYVTDYIKKGANLIFVITNDGWWGGTMGYTQHLRYSQLRAIETRRNIARCANTGISALINQQGEIIKATEWWQQTALSGTIQTSAKITFYVQYGDYIGRVAVFIAICIVLIGLGGYLRRPRST